MSRVADSEQRRQALDPAASFIVQAPAGSGKTELLIQRFLSLLARVQAPEEIIAITFTRKAAAEMQGRIIAALERARTGEEPVDDVTRTTQKLAREVLSHEREQGWQLEENPGRLQIQTIDSLCARLVRQMPLLARLGSRPETVEDASALYREAANNLLEEIESRGEWAEDIATLFSHLDNDMPKVRDLLSGMLARRDQWLRHVAGEINREHLEQVLAASVTEVLARASRYIPAEHVSELEACYIFAAGNLQAGNENGGLPEVNPENLDAWQRLAGMCLTKSGGWRKSVTVKQGFPATAACKDMKDRFRSLLSQLSGNEALRKTLDEVRNLPRCYYSDSEWQLVSALCRLLVYADAGLRVLFGERNQIDFTGIATAAVTALGYDDSPTDLALHLDYRIKHLLVDEFQDVSATQYRLLQQITAGWSGEDEHSLFLVGDPMQSIYRFREADVSYFLTTWEERRLGQIPLVPLNITVNFRSRPAIVNWVNSVFEQMMPERPDVSLGAVSFVPATVYDADCGPGMVSLQPFIGRDDEREAEQVISLVQSTQQDDPGGTVAILVRGRAQLAAIIPRLRAAGLRFQAVEIEQLARRQAIQDVLALTLALNSLADRRAWLALLRAPWCGMTLTDLCKLAGNDPGRTVWHCMHDAKCLQDLGKDGRQRLLKVRSVLELHFAEQGRRDFRRSVESVWISLGGPAALEDSSDLENVQVYFDLLEQFGAGVSLQQEAGFFDAISGLYAAPDAGADASLQLMTIHKAKGLEFDTVIVPGLEKGRRRDEHLLLRWEEFHGLAGSGLLLAPIREAGERQSPIYDFLKNREEQKNTYEEQRLLYVAFTRARQRLYLLGSAEPDDATEGPELKEPRKGSLLSHLWPQLQKDFLAALDEHQDCPSADSELPAGPANRLRRFRAGWELPPPLQPAGPETGPDMDMQPEEPAPEFEWAGETIKQIGIVTHRAIQQVADEGMAKWDSERILATREKYRRALLRLGIMRADLEWAVDSVTQSLLNLFSDSHGRWILDATHTGIRNEYAVSGMYHGRIVNAIIDRTFIDDKGDRWVIDYKTSRHEGPDREAFLDQERERYRPQMEKYRELMRQLDENDRNIRLGLYFPLMRGWREITPVTAKSSES